MTDEIERLYKEVENSSDTEINPTTTWVVEGYSEFSTRCRILPSSHALPLVLLHGAAVTGVFTARRARTSDVRMVRSRLTVLQMVTV